jgi:Flp pilus assembly protein TadG
MILAIRRSLDRLKKSSRSFSRKRNGATAVEFGIIALPFFALKLSIIETALIFWAGQVLEAGTSEASRLIRTGQVQNGGLSATDFRNTICGEISGLFNCDARLAIDVQTYTTFDAAELGDIPVDDDGNYTGTTNWNPGVGGEIVVVRVFYRWPVLFNIMGFDMADIGGRQRLMTSVAAFRNEPF